MPEQAQRDPRLEQLTEAMSRLQPEIVQQILSTLKGPAPTAPTPPSFQGLSPLAATAGALNPQAIPLLMQKEMGPAQAQFQQQQAAFEQAMAGRNQAFQGATALAGAGIRADAMLDAAAMRPYSSANPRLQSKEFVITGSQAANMGLDGSRGWRIRQTFNPSTGEYSEPEVLGETFVSPTVMPGQFGGQAGLGVVGRSGNAKGTAAVVPGAVPLPPEGFVQQAGGAQATLAGLSDFRGIFDKADQAARSNNIAVRTMRDWVGRTRYGGAIAPDVAGYTAEVRRILFPYVKSITGAAFPESELVRYEQQFPVPGFDSPELAQQKIDSLARQIAVDMKAKYGVAGRAAPAGRKTAAQLADELGLK